VVPAGEPVLVVAVVVVEAELVVLLGCSPKEWVQEDETEEDAAEEETEDEAEDAKDEVPGKPGCE
jgi:hypothetical protein